MLIFEMQAVEMLPNIFPYQRLITHMSNILIIDDEKSIRKTLGEILSYEGYKLDEAGDGEEGLKKFRELIATVWMAVVDKVAKVPFVVETSAPLIR